MLFSRWRNNTNKKIDSNQLSGYVSNNKCNFKNFLSLEILIKESEEDESSLNESNNDKKEEKESINNGKISLKNFNYFLYFLNLLLLIT